METEQDKAIYAKKIKDTTSQILKLIRDNRLELALEDDSQIQEVLLRNCLLEMKKVVLEQIENEKYLAFMAMHYIGERIQAENATPNGPFPMPEDGWLVSLTEKQNIKLFEEVFDQYQKKESESFQEILYDAVTIERYYQLQSGVLEVNPYKYEEDLIDFRYRCILFASIIRTIWIYSCQKNN